jgi:hypothetical protein
VEGIKSIAQEWRELRELIHDGTESELQVKETRRAFYAGVAMMMSVSVRMREKDLCKTDVAAVFKSIIDELDRFNKDLQRGRV